MLGQIEEQETVIYDLPYGTVEMLKFSVKNRFYSILNEQASILRHVDRGLIILTKVTGESRVDWILPQNRYYSLQRSDQRILYSAG